LIFDIYVQVNLTLIDNQIKILFPKENIQLSQANNSVVLSGSVTRPELAEHAQKIIEAAGLKVTNLLKSPVLDAAQVQLQVRIAEVNRQVLREIAPAYGIQNSQLPTYISPSGPSQFGGAEPLQHWRGQEFVARCDGESGDQPLCWQHSSADRLSRDFSTRCIRVVRCEIWPSRI
jgi:Flp pilus assembly secretin CpaC